MASAQTIVLFGITGDLAYKKLFPALYELARDNVCPRIIGVARSDHDDNSLAARMRSALAERPDQSVVEGLASRLTYVRGDYSEPGTYRRLAELIGDEAHPVFFMAIPPSLFDDVATGLATAGLDNGRLVIEKPFGRDLQSARDLNDILHRHFDESSIFRIDHFLGKEAVLNLLVFRFANAMMESLWNRDHINRVTITMAEAFDVSGRGGFYEDIGAIRDVVQNHLIQMVALLAMEPPIDDSADALRDEKVKVMRSILPIDPTRVVRGQYEGYRDEEGVSQKSNTETFAALEMKIDSWRWAGVPFSIRTGKALQETVTEAVVEFSAPPTNIFARATGDARPSYLRFRMKPDNTISLELQAKTPGEGMVSMPVSMAVDYGEAVGGTGPDPYERLIGDALEGDARNFARQDGVEASWAVVDSILDLDVPVTIYEPGSWGPAEADEISPL